MNGMENISAVKLDADIIGYFFKTKELIGLASALFIFMTK
jgi:hypothetical protein